MCVFVLELMYTTLVLYNTGYLTAAYKVVVEKHTTMCSLSCIDITSKQFLDII